MKPSNCGLEENFQELSCRHEHGETGWFAFTICRALYRLTFAAIALGLRRAPRPKGGA